MLANSRDTWVQPCFLHYQRDPVSQSRIARMARAHSWTRVRASHRRTMTDSRLTALDLVASQRTMWPSPKYSPSKYVHNRRLAFTQR